jgi:hypothetical protein
VRCCGPIWHGCWTERRGRRTEGSRLGHAATDPGVNVNQLLDGSLLDPLSGNAVLDGIPVKVAVTD